MADPDIIKRLEKFIPKVEPEEFENKTLGGKVGNTIIRAFAKLLNSTTGWFEERLINFAVGVLMTFEKEYANIALKLVDKMLKMEEMPEEIRPFLEEVKEPKSPAGAAIATAFGSAALGGVAATALSNPLRALSYALNKALPNLLPSPEEAILAWRRNKITPELLGTMLKSYGYSEDRQEIKKVAMKAVLGLTDVKDLTLRKEISPGEVNQRIMDLGFDEAAANEVKILFNLIPTVDEAILSERRKEITHSEALDLAAATGMTSIYYDLRYQVTKELLDLGSIRLLKFRKELPDSEVTLMIEKLGYDPETAAKVLELFEYIPPIPDIISFAVREAFTPSVIEEFQLHSEFPPEFEKWAKKQGLSKDWALAYWAAHWVLPPLTLAYQMKWRDIITDEQLDMLLKTQDVMPFWRDKIKQVTYRPYTRVDVRRMYKAGVLDRAAVKRSYLDLGYDEEKAENMTLFTIAEGVSTEKDLTKADVLDGYKKMLIPEGEATTFLTKLGYDQEEAAFYILREDYKRYTTQKKMLLDMYEKMYKKDILDENGIIEVLSAADFKASEIDYHINLWDIEKKVKTSTPALGDLKAMLKEKVISKEEWVKEMSAKKFSDMYIAWYYKLIMKKELEA